MTTAADAILDAIRGAVPVDVECYDALVPGVPAPRYVVAYIPAGMRSFAAVAGEADDITVYFQTTAVAAASNPTYSGMYCRWLSSAVRDALTDLVITADGWAAARIRHIGSEFPRPDEETPDKKVYATDQFYLETVRI